MLIRSAWLCTKFYISLTTSFGVYRTIKRRINLRKYVQSQAYITVLQDQFFALFNHVDNAMLRSVSVLILENGKSLEDNYYSYLLRLKWTDKLFVL